MRFHDRVLTFLLLGLAAAIPLTLSAAESRGTAAEPIRLVSKAEPDFTHHDGGLPPVVGAHNIQVMRANRSQPDADGADGLGWTYSHAPMLCYWNGRFYLEYLTDPVGEHIPPGQTMLTESTDGCNWSRPRVVFPPFKPEGEEEVTVAHQRMGFYVAPNGRLLVLSFYGRAPRPNDGSGIGRAVREIHQDGTFGPIHFIRYNLQSASGKDTLPYPFYKQSDNAEFVAACDALLANKLMTQQWWEEDRGEDGFFAICGQDRGFDAKALSFYHRKDGTVVGLWKKRWAALSFDEGGSWTEPVQIPSLITGGAKIWGQRTDDGCYALAFNPHAAHRWPLVVVTGNDGITFDDMLVAHGEIPYPRFDGQYKSMGPQYVRGIVEGNGNPPGNDLWLTYSVNKEDIWITRLPLPIRGSVSQAVNDTFEDQAIGLPVRDWNIYAPRWAPVAIAEGSGESGGRVLRLQDEDPYDYAKAVRVFPAARQVTMSFRLRIGEFKGGRIEVEVLDRQGRRPVRLQFDASGAWAGLSATRVQRLKLAPSTGASWLRIELRADVSQQLCEVTMNGDRVGEVSFVETTTEPLERLCFRTGAVRDYDAHAADLLIDESKLGDRLDGDIKAPRATFDIDDVMITPR